MRINKYVAQATGLSRRAADAAISTGRVTVNGRPAEIGQDVTLQDAVELDGQPVILTAKEITVLLNKPAGFVSSRSSQGHKTIYELLPEAYHGLKPVGRLDKDSSGILLLTNDGQLAYELTHPKFNKLKVYLIALDKPLSETDYTQINDQGVALEDGVSRLALKRISDETHWQVGMREGRNRQIRRTFSRLGYTVTSLHRIKFGPYELPPYLPQGSFELV